jgi:hypothetical protein
MAKKGKICYFDQEINLHHKYCRYYPPYDFISGGNTDRLRKGKKIYPTMYTKNIQGLGEEISVSFVISNHFQDFWV